MTPEYKTALIRALVSGFATAGLAFCSLFPTLGLGAAGSAAGVSFFGILVTRFGVEGTIDSKRANPPPTE